MDNSDSAPATTPASAQSVLVLQGGGALGSYQAGAFQALCRAGFEPEWVAGISIGAINSAIIAGNAPDKRVDRLKEFWEMVSAPVPWNPVTSGDRARSPDVIGFQDTGDDTMSQNCFRRSTRLSAALPAMIAALMEPIDMPATPSGSKPEAHSA